MVLFGEHYNKHLRFNCAQFYLMIFFAEFLFWLSKLLAHDNPFFRWRLQTSPTVGGAKATAMEMWEVCGRFLHTDHIGPELKYCLMAYLAYFSYPFISWPHFTVRWCNWFSHIYHLNSWENPEWWYFQFCMTMVIAFYAVLCDLDTIHKNYQYPMVTQAYFASTALYTKL